MSNDNLVILYDLYVWKSVSVYFISFYSSDTDRKLLLLSNNYTREIKISNLNIKLKYLLIGKVEDTNIFKQPSSIWLFANYKTTCTCTDTVIFKLVD